MEEGLLRKLCCHLFERLLLNSNVYRELGQLPSLPNNWRCAAHCQSSHTPTEEKVIQDRETKGQAHSQKRLDCTDLAAQIYKVCKELGALRWTYQKRSTTGKLSSQYKSWLRCRLTFSIYAMFFDVYMDSDKEESQRLYVRDVLVAATHSLNLKELEITNSATSNKWKAFNTRWWYICLCEGPPIHNI